MFSELKEQIDTLFDRLHNWLRYHWIINTLINWVHIIWLPIVLGLFGVELGLILPNSTQLTKRGLILTTIVYTIGLFILSCTKFANSKNETDKKVEANNNFVTLISMTQTKLKRVASKKQKDLAGLIYNVTNKQDTLTLEKVMNDPESQIESYLTQLVSSIQEITEIEEEYITVSIIYRCSIVDTEWRMIDINADKNLNAEQIMRGESFAHKLLQSGKSFGFYNDKKNAKALNSYIYTPAEEANLVNPSYEPGSIAGYKSIIIQRSKGKNKNLLEVVLSLSTREYKFSSGGNDAHNTNQGGKEEHVRRNLGKYILPQFSLNICNELLLLILAELYEQQTNKVQEVAATNEVASANR